MNEQTKPKQQSRVWRWRRAIDESDLPPTTRHILQTLSGWMGVNGDSCFPSILDISKRSGRDRKTVREHLAIAETLGWLVVDSAGFSGPQHARKSYVARWPDNLIEGAVSGEDIDGSAPPTDGEFDPDRWGGSPQLEGVDFPTYKTSPTNTPNNSPDKTGAGADSVAARMKIRKQFLDWFPTFPNYSSYSDAMARKEWFKLTEREREDCIRLTPAYVRWIGKGASSPAHYLRDKAWDGVPDGPELIDAKPFSLLWMVTFYDHLFQPPTCSLELSPVEKFMVETGKATAEKFEREKLVKAGWPKVGPMLRNLKKTDRHACPSRLQQFATSEILKGVDPASDLYAAWKRLHAARGWPFFPFAPGRIHLPFVDADAPDLDVAVAAAINEFEILISKV